MQYRANADYAAEKLELFRFNSIYFYCFFIFFPFVVVLQRRGVNESVTCEWPAHVLTNALHVAATCCNKYYQIACYLDGNQRF